MIFTDFSGLEGATGYSPAPAEEVMPEWKPDEADQEGMDELRRRRLEHFGDGGARRKEGTADLELD